MFLFKVSYRVRAHQIGPFEDIFHNRIVPVIQRHHLRFKGIWKTVVGNVGEFLELWEFSDLAEFERQWGALMHDPELLEIFRETGPMVEDENFSLLEPSQHATRDASNDSHKV